MSLQTGQVLQNRYRIIKLLGQGGYGAVYRAWDLNLSSPCAIKENLRSDIGTQFENEAHILQGIKHGNLPRVYDFFTLPSQGQYLVMDFIEGKNLQIMLEEVNGPLQVQAVLTWVEQICEALTYLHHLPAPIIHRDINPKNIIINAQGNAILVDFGIAKVYIPGVKTTQGARAVTPSYSPPEQYGYASTDARTDIYALGVTMYTLLTGQEYPESVQRTINPQLEPAPARTLNQQVPQAVSNAIQIATQIQQDQRFSTVAEFAAALHRVTAPPRKRARAPLPVWMVPVIIALMTVTGFVGMQIAASSAPTAYPPAIPIAWTQVSAVTVVVVAPPASPTAPSVSPNTSGPTQELPIARLTDTSQAAALIAKVNVASANIRTGPNKRYPVLAYLRQGQQFSAIGRSADNDWLLFNLDDGRQGWISISVVDLVGEVPPLIVITPSPLPPEEPTWTPGPRQGQNNPDYPTPAPPWPYP